MFYYILSSPVGDILLLSEGKGLSDLIFRKGKLNVSISDQWEYSESIFVYVENQINDYFNGKLLVFNIKLDIKGTVFQKQVWNLLMDIKYSQLKTYKDIAFALDRPHAVRAVAMAISANPLPIIIPCHRVIGSNGKLVGYAGGIDLKVQLLLLEKASLNSCDLQYSLF